MDPNLLRDHLTQLHQELSETQRVDAASSPVLADLMQDIKRLMGQPTPDAGDASLPDRLERVAVQFEVDHPTLAASSRRLVDLLGKAGL